MRQIYSSPRLENVEAVAKLLNDAGVETWISGGRSYKGNRRGQFSYRDGAHEPSGVWLVKPDDLPRATALLRETGMLQQSTRDRSFVPMAGRTQAPAAAAPGTRLAMRVRLVLVAVLGVLALVTAARMLQG